MMYTSGSDILQTEHLVLGVLIFILTYIAIVSEKINRTVVALFGAGLMILFHILTQAEAFARIDFNTLGLLIGMMIIVNILRQTGIFQYLAIKSAKIAKGEPFRILIYFSILTFVASALLDNVTTILLIVPVTLVICDTLKINPIPFIIAEIMSSNIGGAATLIGDPPNIMIGGHTGFNFDDFIINLLPLMIIVFVVTIVIIRLIFRKSLVTDEESKKVMLSFNENKAITDKLLLKKSLFVLILTITGFILSEIIGVPTATIAMFGATLLLLISKMEPDEIFEKVEWTTIFFFIGLFILVGSLEVLGIIEYLAQVILNVTQGNIGVLTFVILWMSAFLSSFLDNIPYVATMIPLIETISGGALTTFEPVWWALSIGACLGGMGTIIGASANVVARGITEKHSYKITFLGYMKVAFPIMLIAIVISSIYLYIVFF